MLGLSRRGAPPLQLVSEARLCPLKGGRMLILSAADDHCDKRHDAIHTGGVRGRGTLVGPEDLALDYL